MLKVKMVAVADIIIGDRAREDMGNLQELADNIKEKGLLQPVTLNEDMHLRAGGRRTAAAKLAGLDKIPALIRSDLDEFGIDAAEVELIENVYRKDFTWQERAALTAKIHLLKSAQNPNWSANKTAETLGHGHSMNVSRDLKIAEAAKDLPILLECKTQDDALKLLKKAEEEIITKELRRRQSTIKDFGLKEMLNIADGNYRIGDALVELAAIKNSTMISFIEVDPPYGIDLVQQKKQENGGNLVETYNEVPAAEYEAFLENIAVNTFRASAANAWMVFWFGPTHHTLVLRTLRAAGWLVDDIPGIWTKHVGQTNAPEFYLARTYEPFFICRKGQPVLQKRGRSNVFDFAPVPAARKYHPTERPLPLINELLETFCSPGDIALVPFLGSGATLRACYNFGMKGFGYDLNPEYKDKFMLAVQADTEALNGVSNDIE